MDKEWIQINKVCIMNESLLGSLVCIKNINSDFFFLQDVSGSFQEHIYYTFLDPLHYALLYNTQGSFLQFIGLFSAIHRALSQNCIGLLFTIRIHPSQIPRSAPLLCFTIFKCSFLQFIGLFSSMR